MYTFDVQTNKFGTGLLYNENTLRGKTYFECTACISIYAEALSWANANPERVTDIPEEADNIVVLSCQVTELAILNDLRTLERFIENAKRTGRKQRFFIGGCLARRFDIPLDLQINRLDHIRVDGQHIEDRSLVHMADPFWVNDFDRGEVSLRDGYRMRHMYPLRSSVGCHGRCAYRAINVTRGKPYNLRRTEVETLALIEEFTTHDNVLIVADSPTTEEIQFWCTVATLHKKPISFRNVEPAIAMNCLDNLNALSTNGLLEILHVPIQSIDPATLHNMHRDAVNTLRAVTCLQPLRKVGGGSADLITNVIITGRGNEARDMIAINQLFDSVTTNPMWNGQWDRTKAERSFATHFPWTQL